MRAVVMRNGELLIDDVPEPQPSAGQLLVEPIATGVCGSDLSALQHTDDFLQASVDTGMDIFIFDPARDLVMGHEFSSRVVAVGEGVTGFEEGDVLATLPVALDSAGTARCVGYATDFPGALSERVVVEAFGHVKVPAGASPVLAALTEPLTVGFTGVTRSRIEPQQGALVTGCGPVGLGAVAGLSELGIAPIVASDPSPHRRALAAEFGAHATVDPLSEDPVEVWRSLAAAGQDLVVFEASGTTGMINRLLYSVPAHTKIMAMGSCMVDDTIRPVVGIYKNISLQFCMGPARGETRDDFRETLNRIASGQLDAARLVTGYTGLDGAPEVFRLLRPQDATQIEHMKILVCPGLETSEILAPEAVPGIVGGAP